MFAKDNPRKAPAFFVPVAVAARNLELLAIYQSRQPYHEK